MPEGGRPPVVLVHGLMMRSPALLPLAWRLRRRGYAPVTFSYSTLWRSPELAVEALARRLRSFDGQTVHIVAHSLGGLIAAEALCRHDDLPPGRLVFLGSPIAGSAAARGLASRHLALACGRSGPLLRSGLPRLPHREIGVVAGTRPLGLGQLFGRFQDANDGTVAVSETRLPGLADHVVIAASHTGLVFSGEAAALAADFLESGRFSR